MLFLCQKCGSSGFVYGFDIQALALENTKTLLVENLDFTNYSLNNSSHENLQDFLKDEHQANIAVITFNLGYLPGAKNQIVTQESSTIKALNNSLKVLKNQGIISIMIYTGHDGGDSERQAVLLWAESLEYQEYRSFLFEVSNKRQNKETLLVVRKIK